MASECFFKWRFACDDKPEKLIESGLRRIVTIIKCSKIYLDGKHQVLEDSVQEDGDFTVKCHKSCVCTYTSNTQIQRHLKRTKQNEGPSVIPPKKTRLSCASSFSFQEQCLFCGEECTLGKDTKNPARRKPAYLCREIARKGDKSLKQYLLELCDYRDDEWATTVRVRIQRAISDLHAADARYHVACRCKFTGQRALTCAAGSTSNSEVDDALNCLIQALEENPKRIWNSVEMFNAYSGYGGSKLSRMSLVKHVSEYCGEDLLVLSSPGIASILIFRSTASTVLKLFDEEDDDMDVALTKVTKKIKKEVKEIPKDKLHYETKMNRDIAAESVSETMLGLLSKLSPKLDKTLPAILIGSIITTALHNHPTSLQIDLGVVIRTLRYS